MSWAPEQFVQGKWYRNGVRFATQAEAEANAEFKWVYWTQSEGHRATEATEPVNYRWEGDELVAVEAVESKPA